MADRLIPPRLREPVPRRSRPQARTGPRRRWPAVVLLVSLAIAAPAQTALADEEMSGQSSVIVQQALSFLVNEHGATGTAQALAKVDEALAAEDTEGVALSQVRQAKAALQAGDTTTGHRLLQSSIRGAIATQEPATGEDTGTTVVLPPLAPRGGPSGWDWVFLGLSALVAAVGVALSFAFRPREGLRELRRDVEEARVHALATAQSGKEQS